MFYKHGIKRITMDEIARQSGISKKTIYESFKEKDELISAILKEDTLNHQKTINNIALESKNAIDEIVKTMQYMAGFFSDMNPQMFYDLQKYHYHCWSQFNRFKEGFINDCIEKNLKRGVEEEYYRHGLNTRLFARLRVAEMDMCFGGEVFPPKHFNFVEVQIEVMKHFLFGIATLKGHKLITKLLK